ncbi:D-glycerate dehydrogenase [Dokdonella sp.]|uniref:2-hydroxyacid dehydrogenase n=1 Tax=Dokdonella sp. TaxID=2291710 RepID=UPI001B0C0400|nr:D-glycerate dehydrogenase [Dokdonella sp.]MBO9664839.1 D-glycerate dehydrogenase [Dokdonella sp.]
MTHSDHRPRIWVSRPLFDDILDRLREHFDVEVEDDDREWTRQEMAEKLADKAGAILGVADPVDASVLAHTPLLRAIANRGVGYNNLDLAALSAAGVVATNTPGVLDETVADFAWALMLATARRVTEAERYLRAGEWKGMSFHILLGGDVHGRTLGILGMGRIGQAIARRAAGFRMPVIYHNRSRLDGAIEQDCKARYVDRDTLLGEADFLVLTVPMTAETRHIVGAAELARMKRDAFLINIARGGVVDDAALVAALSEKRIAGAGLDVFEREPAVPPAMLALDNVVLTPHIASASLATRRAMAGMAVDNLIAALGYGPDAGRPPNAINADSSLARAG